MEDHGGSDAQPSEVTRPADDGDIDELLDSLTLDPPSSSRSFNGLLTAPQTRSILLGVIGVALLGILLSVVLSWAAFRRSSPVGTEGLDAAAAVEQTQVTEPQSDRAVRIASVMDALGYSGVTVDEHDGVIHLTGAVGSDNDRAAAVGAAQALADGAVIEASALTVSDSAAAESTGVSETAIDAGARADALEGELRRIVAATPIIFGQGEAGLTELHKRILNNVANVFVAYPGIEVTIVGMTDGSGDDAANVALSLRRAESVKAYLVAQGVDSSLLLVDARGESDSTGTDALANLERRVEFEVTKSATTALAPAADTLRIAIVAPSARNDLAFTQSMVDAVAVIDAERGNVDVDITDNTFVPEDAEAAIRGYADGGYDLIIAHGSQFGVTLQELAPLYPDVAFAWGTASDNFGLPNIYAYDAAAEEGGFVLGSLAATLSTSQTIGVVGPIEVGDAALYINGFKAGAANERPGTNVTVTYTNSFSDLSLAAEAAEGHIGSGADVMTGSAQMVVGAVSVAEENDVLWFGTQSNQSSLAPDLVVASQVYHWEVILRQIITDIDGGVPSGRSYTANLANGGVVVEYNPGFGLSPEIQQRGDTLVAGIIAGVFDPPR